MTNDQDLPPGLSAATRNRRGAPLLLLLSGLCMACVPAFASTPKTPATAEKSASSDVSIRKAELNAATEADDQNIASVAKTKVDAPTALAVAETPARAPAKETEKPKGGLKAMASGAAASTLTLLLPHVAAGEDSLPLLGRSGMVANDLSRLLSGAEAPKDNNAHAGGANEKVQSVLKRALALLGTPYRWGGTSPDSGFDCSGLVGYVFRSALGIELPRVSRDMARKEDALLIKDREELREGDLVFFSRSKGRVDHVGIYLGEGKFVHSPRTGKDVEVASLVSGYWAGKFLQARRVPM